MNKKIIFLLHFWMYTKYEIIFDSFILHNSSKFYDNRENSSFVLVNFPIGSFRDKSQDVSARLIPHCSKHFCLKWKVYTLYTGVGHPRFDTVLKLDRSKTEPIRRFYKSILRKRENGPRFSGIRFFQETKLRFPDVSDVLNLLFMHRELENSVVSNRIVLFRTMV